MSMRRYAIYLAPPADTALWRFGSDVLGYDAATGEDRFGFAVAGFKPEAWRRSTERPRTYGFHATLKAPFRLAEGRAASELRTALGRAALAEQAFDAGPLAVTSLAQGGTGFVALTLQRPSAELSALESRIVAALDPFRAPPTEAEWAARQPDRLTARQRHNLACWGYPYVGEDFTFHMTLSGAVERPDDVADELARIYAGRVGSAHMAVDALVLFEQAESGHRFRITERFPLSTSA